MPNKRDFLARCLRNFGVLWLLERARRRPGLLVITHHRIGDPTASAYYEPVFSASPTAFREQVCYLRDHFRVVTLTEVESGTALNEPSVLIAFDDGYRDNFDTAYPILKELGVPATFFIPTTFFEKPRLPWWDHTAYVLKQTARDRIVLDWPMPMSIELTSGHRSELASGGHRAAAIWSVVLLYLASKLDDEARFRAHLEDRAEVAVDEAALGPELFMTWDQVRLLAQSGMAIGSHSHSHRRMASLSEEQQREELMTSKQILEHELGFEVRSVAYPFGWEGAYNELTKQQARAAGYHLGFSAQTGLNEPGRWDPFAICRVGIGFGDTPAMVQARTSLYRAFGRSVV